MHVLRGDFARLGAAVAAGVAAELEHNLDGVTLKKTASLGVAARDGQGEFPNAEDLLKQADEALYRAKQNGRNRVEVA